MSYTLDETELILFDSDQQIFEWLYELKKKNEKTLRIELPIPIKRDPEKMERACNSYFTFIGVDSTGALTGCRRFLPPDSAFGVVGDADAWNGYKFREMRRTFLCKDVKYKDFCRYCVACQ